MVENIITPRRTLKHVIIVENDKGGSGKTTTSDALATGFLAAGARLVVLDCDAGNRGYIRRAGKNSAIPVDWDIAAAAAEDFIADHLADADFLLMDFAANLRASGAQVLSFLSELLFLLSKGGAAILRCGVASTNAAGTDVLMSAVTDGFSKIAQTVIIENDVDGSGSFSAGLAGNPTQRVKMRHIEPALMALRLRRVEPLIAILEAPSPRYVCATAALARHVLDLVSQSPFAEIVGEVGVAKLRVLARAAPGPLYYSLRSVKSAQDDRLRANEAVWTAVQALGTCSEADAWSAITAFRDAQTALSAAKLPS